MKRLIINADDFGFTRDVNAGIVYAHKHGVLTSTTLMANGDAFDDAVRLAGGNPSLDVGCHLVLIQGRSLITGKLYPERPRALLAALATHQFDLYAELRSQIEKMLAAGIVPTHLDTHKHAHILPGVFRTVVCLAAEYKVPFVRLPLDDSVSYARVPCAVLSRLFRRLARGRAGLTDHFRGFRLTGSLTEQTFADALAALPDGTTEFMCHPGFCGAELRDAPTRLKESREIELQALVSPRIRSLMDAAGVRLEAFGKDLLQAP